MDSEVATAPVVRPYPVQRLKDMVGERTSQAPKDPGAEPSIEERILTVRGQRVILDAGLAKLYGTTTKRLNEQVRRNIARFPEDFVFRLTRAERVEVVAICDHLHNLKYSSRLPLVFTEHGAIMAAGVLNAPRAVQMSVFVVRAFVRLRRFLVAHGELAAKVAELERTVGSHDKALQALVKAIRGLLEPPPPEAPGRIGFHAHGPPRFTTSPRR